MNFKPTRGKIIVSFILLIVFLIASLIIMPNYCSVLKPLCAEEEINNFGSIGECSWPNCDVLSFDMIFRSLMVGFIIAIISYLIWSLIEKK